ncbi:unnamed protein product, partial [Cladocopium goreaui]
MVHVDNVAARWTQLIHLEESIVEQRLAGDVLRIRTTALSDCTRHFQWRTAVALKRGCVDVIFFNSYLAATCAWPRAIELLAASFRTPTLQPDVTSFNSCMNRLQSWPCALEVTSAMQELQLRSDTITLNTLLAASPWPMAGCLLEMGQVANRITHNTLLSAFEKGSHWRKALLHLEGVEPDLISFNSVISAGEKGDQWPLSADLYCQLQWKNLEADVFSGSATLSAFEKGSAWQNALLLVALLSKMLPLNVVPWNATISACEKEGEWEWALLLLRSMAGAQPDVISFNAAISACERVSQWEVALLLFHEGQVACALDHISINALLGALARAAQWRQALQISTDASKEDVIGANAVVRACAAGNQWRWATLLLQEMESGANAVSYAAALVAYQAMMQWLLASALLEANRQHAMAVLKKVPKSAPSTAWRKKTCAE